MQTRWRERVAGLMSIGILALMAGATWWLGEQARKLDPIQPERPKRHEPDFEVDRLVLVRTQPDGTPSYRLTAERMRHYPDDDSSELDQPILISLAADRPQTTIVSKSARVTAKASEVHLSGDVRIDRAGGITDNGGQSAPLQVRTEYLLVLPQDDIARTDRFVTVTQGPSFLTGTGMELNNSARTLVVNANVRASWAGAASPAAPR